MEHRGRSATDAVAAAHRRSALLATVAVFAVASVAVLAARARMLQGSLTPPSIPPPPPESECIGNGETGCDADPDSPETGCCPGLACSIAAGDTEGTCIEPSTPLPSAPAEPPSPIPPTVDPGCTIAFPVGCGPVGPAGWCCASGTACTSSTAACGGCCPTGEACISGVCQFPPLPSKPPTV